MSRTQTRAFDLLLNTRDGNCRKLGPATYRYYLKEPIQLLKKKFECGVKLIYMPNKTKTIDFTYGTSKQIKEGSLSTGKSTSISYNGIVLDVNSLLMSQKIDFQYRHSKFAITNKREQNEGDLFISGNLLREFGFTVLLKEFDEVTAYETTLRYLSIQIEVLINQIVTVETRISDLKNKINENNTVVSKKKKNWTKTKTNKQ